GAKGANTRGQDKNPHHPTGGGTGTRTPPRRQSPLPPTTRTHRKGHGHRRARCGGPTTNLTAPATNKADTPSSPATGRTAGTARPLPHGPARVHTPATRSPNTHGPKDNHDHHTAPVHPLGDPGTGPGGLHGPDRPPRPTRTHPGNTAHTPGSTPGRDPLRGPGLRPGPGRAHRPGVRAGQAHPAPQRRVLPRTQHPVRRGPGPAGFSSDRTRGPHPHGRGRTPDRPGEPLHPVRGGGRCGPPRGRGGRQHRATRTHPAGGRQPDRDRTLGVPDGTHRPGPLAAAVATPRRLVQRPSVHRGALLPGRLRRLQLLLLQEPLVTVCATDRGGTQRGPRAPVTGRPETERLPPERGTANPGPDPRRDPARPAY